MLVTLDDNFKVDFSKPMTSLPYSVGKAFEVESSLPEGGAGHFGILCDPRYPPRLRELAALRQISVPNLLMPLGHYVVRQNIYPVADPKETLLLLCKKPDPLVTLFKKDTDTINPVDPGWLMDNALVPILNTLVKMHSIGIAHRNITPQNIHLNLNSHHSALLGQCFSAPVGSAQNPIFEPVTFAEAEQFGRGPGSWYNDTFALGISMVSFLLGRIPFAHTPFEDMLHARTEGSTYNLITANTKLPERWIVLLRGMIQDDPARALTIEDLFNWIYHHKTSTRPTLGDKMTTTIVYKGFEHRTLPSFAHRVSLHWAEARSMLTSNHILTWIARAVSGKQTSHHVLEQIRSIADLDPQSANNDRAIARSIMALSPTSPIRMEDYSVRPFALIMHAAININNAVTLKKFEKVFSFDMLRTWLAYNEYSLTSKEITSLNSMQSTFGAGGSSKSLLELFYEYYPDLPCRDLMFEGYYVMGLESCMIALDDMAKENRLPPQGAVISDNLAKFISVCAQREKVRISTGPQLTKSAGDQGRITEEAKFLENLQRQLNMGALNNLCEFIRERFIKAAGEIQLKSRREKITKQLRAVSHGGMLAPIIFCWSDGTEMESDSKEFNEAKRMYRSLISDEINLTEIKRGNYTSTADRAETVSVLVSNIIGLAGLSLLLFSTL